MRTIDPEQLLVVLDACAADFSFPCLDNGYFYLAAARLTLHRSVSDWGLVIETFGYSPRVGLPDTNLYTFASKLRNRDGPKQYVSREAYRRYLELNPHNEFRSAGPLDEGPWQGDYDVAEDATEVVLRGKSVPLPTLDEYAKHGIELASPPTIAVHELCRWLAATHREQVLATPQERKQSLGGGVVQILQLEDWHYPDLAGDERPSDTETFRQLAEVLATGDLSRYRTREKGNTHWRNWPMGGTL